MLYLSIGASITLFGLLLWVWRHSRRYGQIVDEQAQRMRRLYAIAQDSDMALGAQLAKLLSTSCEILGFDACSAIRVDHQHLVGEVVNCQAYSHPPCTKNRTLHLEHSLALETYQQNRMLMRQGPELADYQHSPVCRESQSLFYLGLPLVVNNRLYGVLNFYADTPRNKSFSTIDIEFINLISTWVRVIIERITAQEQMEQATRSARAANEAKSYFLANMSHEIRTPLTTIIGYSENLKSLPYLEEEARKNLNTVIRAGHHLHQLINDILDLSKIEAGQLLVERIATSPLDILQHVVHLVQPLANAKNLRLHADIHYPVPAFVITDPTRLQQVLLNLCGNAVKFTEHGEVTVRMRYLEPMNKLQFSVIDTGIGMTEEEMERILKPFSQADSTITRRFGGTGLGLYISHQLVEKLGGYMSFFSKKFHGSEFDFTIDVGDIDEFALLEKDSEFDSHDEPAGDTEYRRIGGQALVVDDTAENRELLKFYLNKIGIDVEEAANGMEALTILKYKSYDLVLMDTNMPELDGISTIKALREAGYSQPILSVSANALQEDFQQSVAAGANGYLLKPLEPKKFYDTIYQLLEQEPEQAPPTKSKDPRFESLVNRFLEHLPEKLRKLTEAVSNEQWELAADISHNLKGLGGGYGFHSITEHAKLVNDELKRGRYEFVPQLCEQLVRDCEQVLRQHKA